MVWSPLALVALDICGWGNMSLAAYSSLSRSLTESEELNVTYKYYTIRSNLVFQRLLQVTLGGDWSALSAYLDLSTSIWSR